MTTPAAPCSRLTREAEEDPAGSAPRARTWVVVVQQGPWPVPATAAAAGDLAGLARGLPEVSVVMAAAAQVPRRGRRRREEHGPAAILCGTVPGRTWRRDLAEYSELLQLLDDADARRRLAGADDPGTGTLSTRPLVLVCTHAARDSCCGRFGPPAADAVRAAVPHRRRLIGGRVPEVDVMESSHLGGHRFAPTALVLPWGFALGGLGPDPSNLAMVVEGFFGGRPLIEGYRGRTCFAPAGQAGEAAARRWFGERGTATGRDGLDVDSVTEERDPPAGPGPATVVHVRHESGPVLRVTVRRRRSEGPARPMSCGEEAVPVDGWTAEVTVLAEGDGTVGDAGPGAGLLGGNP